MDKFPKVKLSNPPDELAARERIAWLEGYVAARRDEDAFRKEVDAWYQAKAAQGGRE